jgi:predicted negative regulator of RcsB-dependent stress response
MAAFDLEEQEQLEALKAWWKRWGNFVIYGLSAVLLGVAGYQYWNHYTSKQTAEAAEHYDNIARALEAGDMKTVKERGALLIDKYGRTPYAARAAMLLASVNMQARDAKSAKAQLEWVVEHTKEAALRDVSRLRLAGLLLDDKQYDAALKQLTAAHTDAYAARFDDLKGDVYLAQGKTADARAAYSAAYAKLKETNPLRGVVEMKLDSLGGAQK